MGLRGHIRVWASGQLLLAQGWDRAGARPTAILHATGPRRTVARVTAAAQTGVQTVPTRLPTPWHRLSVDTKDEPRETHTPLLHILHPKHLGVPSQHPSCSGPA